MANFSKYITHGALVVAGVSALLAFSEAAKAATFTVGQITTPGFKHVEGDKTFSDFAVTGTTTELADQVSISFVGGNYQVNYSSNAGTIAALTTPGTFSYKVTIGAGFTNTFLAAGTDAQGGPLAGQDFTKILAATGLTPLEFKSPPGSPVNGFFTPGLKTIDVTSSWSFGPPGPLGASYINGFSDKFIQVPTDPTPITQVPEPSTVLGLVALGLAGLMSRTVSKSLGN